MVGPKSLYISCVVKTQDTIDYVSTAYFDQKKFKSIYYIKELFSADASIFKKKIKLRTICFADVSFTIRPRTFSGVGRSKSNNINPKIITFS